MFPNIRRYLLNKNKFMDFCRSLWTKIWGKELPPEDDATRGRSLLKKIYNDLQIKLRLRRLLVSMLISAAVLWILFGGLGTVLNHPALVCAGKDICIYRGAKLNYPSNSQFSAVKLNNGNVFVVPDAIYIYPIGIINLPFNLYRAVFFTGEDSFLSKNARNFEKFYYKDIKKLAEIYDAQKKKFVKAENMSNLSAWRNKFFLNSENDVVILSTASPVEIFDTRSMRFEKTEKNLFNKFYKPLKSYLYFIKQYDENRLLVFTNNSDEPQWSILSGRNKNVPLSHKEQAYLMNLQTFRLEKLPEFARKPKYYPIPDDVKIYKNGKILIPIRNCSPEKQYICKSLWDHIEIYDPVKNVFLARDAKYLKENIFDIELPSGDVLFINKNSSYYLKKETNEFVKTSSFESGKYKVGMYMLDKELQKTLNIYLDEPISGNVKFIKISPAKYLLTCGDNYFNFPLSRSPNGVCKKTILYDYETNTIKSGPTVKYSHYKSSVVQMDKNTFLFVGGVNDSINSTYDIVRLPNRSAQILKIKE